MNQLTRKNLVEYQNLLWFLIDKKNGYRMAQNIIKWSSEYYENHCDSYTLLCAKNKFFVTRWTWKIVYNGRDDMEQDF
jgi:hypothetical protein